MATTGTGPGAQAASWDNAPILEGMVASQQGGSRGAQIWGADENYALITDYQTTPGGSWSGWFAVADQWPNGPEQVLQMTACQQNNGCVQFWVTDDLQQLWTISQTSPGGGWGAWSGPNWNSSPLLSELAASQQGGNRGGQLFATDETNALWTCYQETPGGAWSPWLGGADVWPNGPQQVLNLTACQQNNGCVQLWVTDDLQQLWTISQTSPGGGWGTWSGPNWNSAPPLNEIAASQQGGTRGAQLWAVDQNYSLISTFQETPGGSWSAWSSENWSNSPPVVFITACQQNNGCVQLWAMGTDDVLRSISQTSPGGDWGSWSS